MDRDLDSLKLIRRAAEALVEHVRGYDESSFLAERKTQSAVLYEIVVMGEGVKRLSSEFGIDHPETPCKQIAGMRDRVVHSFDEVDLGIVWNVSQVHAPSLITTLVQIEDQGSNT
jgi:uncharacterized protein with HEPN domain